MTKSLPRFMACAIAGSALLFSQSGPNGSHIHVVGGSINFEYRNDLSKWHGIKNSTCPFEKQNTPFYNQVCVAKTGVKDFYFHVDASDQQPQNMHLGTGPWEIDLITAPAVSGGVTKPIAICSNLNAANTGCDLSAKLSNGHVYLVPLDPSVGFLATAAASADPGHTGMLFTFSDCRTHDGETCEILRGFSLSPPPANGNFQFTCLKANCRFRLDKQ